ncbi:MAG: thioether cross-link-forming SCIFF peptide maturase [Eubacteriales bacterium]|jgi:uncharacterized protein
MIHKYYMNGYYIVLDVNSGCVHVVDKLVYDLLDHLPNGPQGDLSEDVFEAMKEYPREEVESAYQDICQLTQNGQLFSSDDYEELAKSIQKVAPVKALCLHVAHDCNLRCEYCFASTGEYNSHKRSLMSLEVGKKAIDMVIRESANRRNIEIDFFGGEPLMNFDVVKQLVLYAREQEKIHDKHFRFTITTNGMLLTDDKIDFINEHMDNIVLSLDGRREVNDRMRKTVTGAGCYDIVLPKFKKVAESRHQDRYYIRGTFTRYNLDFCDDVLHFVDEGFEQISVEPVATDPSMPYAIQPEDLPKVFAEYEKLAVKLLEKRKEGHFFNFFHFMIDLSQGPCVIKRLHGCGCGNEYLAVTPEGDIYPCHQFVGMENFKMGNVFDGKLDMDIKTSFACTNVYTKPECKKCWAKFYCSGGCNANSYQYAGDIHLPYTIGCEMEKKRVECAIMMKAAQADA